MIQPSTQRFLSVETVMPYGSDVSILADTNIYVATTDFIRPSWIFVGSASDPLTISTTAGSQWLDAAAAPRDTQCDVTAPSIDVVVCACAGTSGVCL